ncbi:histidine kinase [Actimicrobium sp. CCC2.4]|uniref:PAS domain-containing sensor histidine kinase n=1 Tax=Actimicrobium sp. CCC2.4 TaxID=3048606 RepID=UPI002AC975DF|nr:histidine kinase [Actimicrobium sp. CCC2.4]MEB0133758.1 histidine kinase [Actimicrobium sp. CCC2.4]WPX31303.1 histidine kinase [Actimicrobium sp. CCC2.4]
MSPARQADRDGHWLRVAMQECFDEISVLDVQNFGFIEINRAAQDNLQYCPQDLFLMQLFDIAPDLDAGRMQLLLDGLRTKAGGAVNLETRLVRKDGSIYPVQVRFVLCDDQEQPALLMICKDQSAGQAASAAFGQIEARFHAIVSNTPGLVYQFRRMPDNAMAFPYLSDACHALLGIRPERLHADPGLFMALILPADHASYLASMQASAEEVRSWNWDGRLWIEEWKDIKWINLRAMPRVLPDGAIQWEGIMTNITQSKLEQTEITRSREQLAELSAHIERVKEEERTRIAREIHDDLGGNLTAIKMALALLRRRLPDDPALTDKADYVDSLVDRTIESIHRISVDLRPSILDFGIVAAIEWQAAEFEKQLGIPCHVASSDSDIDLPPEQASALFRIFQESLNNISKHARASSVQVRLIRNQRGIRMEISDNGTGIAARDRQKPASFGIRGMIERANALGGSLSVSNVPKGGSVVAIRIPLPAASGRLITAIKQAKK